MRVDINTHIGTRYVILTKHWMWLPDDGFMWTETFWSSFYNLNYFNNLKILQFMCISWKIKCLIYVLDISCLYYYYNDKFAKNFFPVSHTINNYPTQLYLNFNKIPSWDTNLRYVNSVKIITFHFHLLNICPVLPQTCLFEYSYRWNYSSYHVRRRVNYTKNFF